jgi:hypothetical protein
MYFRNLLDFLEFLIRKTKTETGNSMSQLLACGPALLARPSNEMNPGPAHVQDMARVRAQEAVTALRSLAAVRQPATTEATRCGGTGSYIMRTTTGGRLTWSWGLRLTEAVGRR